jgi:hypothetical protein
MNRRQTTAMLFILLTLPAGCSKSSQATNSNVAVGMPLVLTDKAKLVEERLVNGETVSESDVQGLSSTELRILRNASFARHGRKYDSPGLGDYFNKRTWYKPREDYNDNLLTVADKANVKLILAAEQRAGTTTTPNANSSAAISTQPPPPTQPVVTTAQPGGGGGQLTTDKVQRAVDKALDWTRKGGRATVLGIQETPRENAARADVRFDGFQYNANSYDMPISKDQKTPPEPDVRDPKWSEKMYQNRAGQVHTETYSGQGNGILKHYNDGRWVLTGVQFGLHGVNSNIEIR